MDEPTKIQIRVPSDGRLWTPFWNDLKWSFGSWVRRPGFVVLLAFYILFLRVAAVVSPFVYLIVAVGTLGIVGTERIYYLRDFYGLEFSLREVPRLTRRFFGRFLALGLIVGIPTAVIFVICALAESGYHPHDTNSAVPLRLSVTYLVVLLFVDALLTFVTPILVFSTRSANEALRVGVRFLRHTWPKSLWYVFTPGLTLVGIDLVFPTSKLNTSLGYAIAIVGGLLAFAFKGAAVPFYLRCIDPVDDDDGVA